METEIQAMDPQILGTLLQRARKEAGLKQDAAAKAAGISRSTLIAIEKGERKVKARELFVFAKEYKCDVSVFVRVPVTFEDFVPQFRSESDDSTGEAALAAATELSRLSKSYMELEKLTTQSLPRRYPQPILLASVGASVEQAAEDMALQERNRLGLGDGPIVDLRSLLENDVGLRIFCFKMKGRLAGVFGCTDTLGGCIGINSQQPLERQRWSLAHEYGHFLSTRFEGDFDTLGGKMRSAAERFADGFAKHFLMPASGVNRRATELQMGTGDLTLAHVFTLADTFVVSVQAMVLRLEGLKRIRSGTWESLTARGMKVKEVKKELGINCDPVTEPKFPTRFRTLAVLARQTGKLSEDRFAETLELSISDAREIYNEAMGRLVSEDKEGFGLFDADLDRVLS